MRKNKRAERTRCGITVLVAVLCILVTFACVSISKFVLTDKKELVGVYTDFILSHDGNGQTAVIQTDNEGNTSGYISTTVSNFTEEKVSRRDVKFSMRAPTDAETEAGFVSDAWGVRHDLYRTSKYYDVSIVDENDNEFNATGQYAVLAADVRNSCNLLLKIKRKANAEVSMPDEGTEQLSIILETNLPYRDLQVFTVNTTMARLSVGVFSDVYNGFTRETVNLKSATQFVRDSNFDSEVSYLAKVEFVLSGFVTFDYVRFEEMYGQTPQYDETVNKYTLNIQAGADVNLYFYVTGKCDVKVSATIYDGKTPAGSEKVSGVGNDNIVFSNSGRTI